MTLAPTDSLRFAIGSLVRARGREWVVQAGSAADFLLLQPLGGAPEDVVGVFADEGVEPAAFAPPTVDDLGTASSTALLRTALRIGFTSSAGPFRSLAGLAVEPRSYQYVPLLLALRHDVVRILIADDVGIGKTIEAGLIAAELLAQGDARRLAVLCSPALAEQWQRELREKFGISAVLVLTSTVKSLERNLLSGQSLFEEHPHVIVSTDFIKSDRHRFEFLRTCPELVIVDEAHNSVAGGGANQRSQHQRFELLRGLAEDPRRHLILATATPHSGDEAAFSNLLGLLVPALATADLGTDSGRRLLAQHFVQRRRADIRRYLDEDTPFPRDRQTLDVPYALSANYAELFADVLAYARERVRDHGGVHGRVQWWTALALLRALASSPRAAVATLKTRAAGIDAADEAEADALGRASVLDATEGDTIEAPDTTPGAETDSSPADSASSRRLKAFATRAQALCEPGHDRKLDLLTRQVRALLDAGDNPIVFCRFLDTADYVAGHLQAALPTKRRPVGVDSVTGRLAPAERERRVAALTTAHDARVLVATDCLSEGVNLQDSFTAVVHYDLAWNPTRHEQREGRVDRFGQRAEIVKAVTIWGEDNGIDELVLRVLIRKHREIARATGVAVPVPGDGQALINALAEGLLLGDSEGEALTLDLGLDVAAQALDAVWQSAAEKERVSRTRYAQATISPDEVSAEVAAVRAALGRHGDVEGFTRAGFGGLGATISPAADGLSAMLGALPPALRSTLPVGLAEPLTLRLLPPARRGGAVLSRTDPVIRALARHVVETALDPISDAGPRLARRAGVMRTAQVSMRTTILLVRMRFQLTLPTFDGVREIAAEDARVLAFTGPPNDAAWLADDDAERLLDVTPSGNIDPGLAGSFFGRFTDGLPDLTPHLEAVADQQAQRLLEAHRRVRAGAQAVRRGLSVTALKPIDVLSVQILLPETG